MADEPKRTTRWVPSRTGSIPEIYTNYTHASWTLFDVRVRLGHLVSGEPFTETGKEFVAEELGAVTFSWPQAKFMRDMLTRLVASYEETNGEIKPLKLPPDPTSPIENPHSKE
ncbi:MAG: hypothetical protein WBD45_04050 [Terriglobales bacterium]